MPDYFALLRKRIYSRFLMTETTPLPLNQFFRRYSLRDFRAVPSSKNPKVHQQDALAKLSQWYGTKSAGPRGAILVLPTGGGKTFTAVRFLCEHPLSDGYKVLWLAHTHHLLEQAMHAFDDSAGSIVEPKNTLDVRVVSGALEHCKIHQIKASDDVVVGSLQAICKAMSESHGALEGFVKSAKSRLLVVFDEAHHAPAPSYRRLLVQLRELCPDVVLLGLTATPFYSDEKRAGWLRKLFPQGIIHQVTANALMASGVLSQPVIENARTKMEVSVPNDEYVRWVNTNKDLPEEVVTELAERRERNEFIANYYATNKTRLGKTIIFADRWSQCVTLTEMLERRKIRADAVFSHVSIDRTTPEKRNQRTASDNAKIIARFKQDELDVLINVRMLTEGTDVPKVQSVFLTRQTTSQSLLVQMIGRALRGPAVGGTEKAYIVSFIDDWQQRIKWAEYATLAEGQADDSMPDYAKHPPIQMISIDLIRGLAKQMDSGINSNPTAFTSILPIGWYRTEYDTLVAGTDEIETVSPMVLVYEHDKNGFYGFFNSALAQNLKDFEELSVDWENLGPRVELLAEQFFPGFDNSVGVSVADLVSLLRHIAQNEKAIPRFFEFGDRDKHNLDLLAEKFIADDKGPLAIEAALRSEFARADLFWSAIYSRYEQFRSTFDGCMNYVLRGRREPNQPSAAKFLNPETPVVSEPSSEVKEQVFRRDQRQCLCCGATYRLRIDHIKARYHGGGNEVSNLQTLCMICNGIKAIEEIDFRLTCTPLLSPPAKIPDTTPIEELETDWSDLDRQHQTVRRWINFFYRCDAVDALEIAEDEVGHRTTKLKLHAGNDRSWVEPYLSLLNVGRNQPPQSEIRLPEANEPPDEGSYLSDDNEVIGSDTIVRLDEVLDAIKFVEGFQVCIRNAEDRKVRGDMVLHGCGPYPFRRKLNDSKTFNTWKMDRFLPNYPIFEADNYRIEVLDGEGSDRPGNIKLRTLRDSYFV